MLSVVLYGRNDSHGYNLHKRAAISLNAIAELLTDPDDEILFVDYNTPDDLPTFPEAIADTLTDKAVARLKILRVREGVHRERFAARTHLAALEPVARNVAIRRANSANKWVLSTNTDMIFCPRMEGRSLTSAIGALPDGFYHLPRFELPEGLWESLDRKDAPRVIAAARAWGERFHLNEITHADRDNVYDAPGDFQLFLRQDLLDIDGFHEEMILGWHLDANIAKRMRLLRGKVSSALDLLIGYHCDHTRQSSPYHKADRAENDLVRFTDQVTRPQIPEQHDRWGLADLNIETFQLGEGHATRYFKGLQASVPAPLTGFLETQYVLEDYGRMQYPADHVLPYLLDLVSCIPSTSRIGYIGGRADTWDKFLAGWRAMGGGRVSLPQDVDWLADHDAGTERLTIEDWIEQSDMFIFDVGAQDSTHHLDLTDADSARLWSVDQAFKETVARDLERQADGRPARMVLVINGVHNFFEPQVMPDVAVTLTPYSSRIRHGYISQRTAARIAGASGPGRAAMVSLQALEPPSKTAIAALGALLARLTAAHVPEEVWREAAMVSWELEVYIATGLLDAGLKSAEIMAQLRGMRPSDLARRMALPLRPDAGRGAKSRLVRLEDWDDPAWALVARRLFSNRDHALLFNHHMWTWERVTLAQNLMAAAPVQSRPHVLVVGQSPEILAFALAHQGYTVDIADPRAAAAGELVSIDWREQFKQHGWVSPRPVGRIEDRAEAIAQGWRYDAVLLAQSCVFVTGRVGVADVLRGAAELLKTGGHLGFTATTQPLPNEEPLHDHLLPIGLVGEGGLGHALDSLTCLALDGDIDGRLTPRTLDRWAPPGASATVVPALVGGHQSAFEALGVWALRKTDRSSDWAELKAVLELGAYGVGSAAASSLAFNSGLFFAEDLLQAPNVGGVADLGSRFESLIVPQGLSKTLTALRVPSDFGAAVCAIAPLGRILAGSYELEIEVDITRLSSPGAVLVVGVVSDGRLMAEQVIEADRSGAQRVYVALDVGGEGWIGAAVVIKAQGLADLDILNLALR